MSGRGRPLSIAAFVSRASAVLEESRKGKDPDRWFISFAPEDAADEPREIDPREIRTRTPEPGRYVFVERIRQADGAQAELELYECRVTKAAIDREREVVGPTMLDLRASLDAALVAQRGVSEQWRGVAESESRRSQQTHDLLMSTIRERDARETALRADLATMTERAVKAEAAASGWRAEHVTALIPLVDRAIGLYQGQADDRALVKLLDALPVDLRDRVLDELDRREGKRVPR